MKKLLIVGNSPLVNENTKSRPAAGLRTYQFLKPLLKRSDLLVKLITIAMPECYEGRVDRKELDYSKNCSQVLISKDDAHLAAAIQKIHDDFGPEMIIGVNTYPCFVTAGLNSEAAFWADLNGWVMAEAQAQAYKVGSNDYIGHYLAMQERILRRADRFSVVSGAQRLALYGELAGMGRLNKETFGYEFVTHIANGTEFFEGERKSEGSLEALESLPEDAFVLAWIGGYNTWVDEETLFEGLERAMRENEKLYFVSTGGAVKGLDEGTFGRFKAKIDNSEFRERFVFLGWVETRDIPLIYERADAGLNVDRMCVETWTGARNRINEMMKFGLPVVTTRGSEIAGEVGRIEAGIVVDSGDVEALREAILKICGGDGGYGERGRRYIEEECGYERLQAGVMEWIRDAKPAPDRGVRVDMGRTAAFRSGIRYLKENGVRKFSKKLLQKVRGR